MSVFLDSELTSDERNEDARFHVIPVPIERTVSYGSGTAKAPPPSSKRLTSLSVSPTVANPVPQVFSPKRLWTAQAICLM